MDRVERRYYLDGMLREEVHYRGNKEHGPWRVWHPNGVLAEEYFFEDGIYNTCVLRTWFDNGNLSSEVTWVNAHQVGRVTVYNEDGSILHRHYSLEDGMVSRAMYDKACQTRPELPKYTDPDPPVGGGRGRRVRKETPEGVPARSVANSSQRPVESAEVERSREFVKARLASKHAEALEWLRGGPKNAGRTLGEMAPELSIEFVERLYELGAVKVLAVEIVESPGDDDQTTNHVLVELPTDTEARGRLFEFERAQAESEGFEAEGDRGQEYVYLKLC